MKLAVKFIVLICAKLTHPASAKMKVHIQIQKCAVYKLQKRSKWSVSFKIDLEVERFEFQKQSDKSVINFERFKYKKFNRTSKVFSGEIEILKDMDDSYTVSY
jgi:hypothetical protein